MRDLHREETPSTEYELAELSALHTDCAAVHTGTAAFQKVHEN